MSDRATPQVLVLASTDLSRDPRVYRQIRTLRESYSVIAAGTADPEIPGVKFIPLSLRAKKLPGRLLAAARLLSHRYESYYWATRIARECRLRLSGLRPQLIVANDIETLPVALELSGDSPVLFDAHEYAPRQFENLFSFRLFHQKCRTYICRKYLPRVSAMTTVCEGLAKEYHRVTGVLPDVVWNAPEFTQLEPVRGQADRLRLVHHGCAQRSRHLELMIQMMKHLNDRFELNLVLTGPDTGYINALRREAGGDSRIRFLDPVPMPAIVKFLNKFDVGVFLLPPVNFNYRNALPNKFFEFVQARLAVAIGPTPEMARLTKQYDLGLVSPDFTPESLAGLLSGLTSERVQELKLNSDRAARALSAEPGRRTMLRLAGDVLDGCA